MKFGMAFKHLRETKTCLSQTDICKFIDDDGNQIISHSSISRWECGIHSLRIEKIAGIMDHIDEFNMHDLIDLTESD